MIKITNRQPRRSGNGGRAMKTPDEIKQALRLCDAVCCTLDCPYFRSTSANCVKKLHKNALAYVKRLEAEREGKNDESA